VPKRRSYVGNKRRVDLFLVATRICGASIQVHIESLQVRTEKEVTLIYSYRSIFFKDHLHHISMWSLAPILFFSLENKSFHFSYSEKESEKSKISFKKAE
jgi:hypothetical protein